MTCVARFSDGPRPNGRCLNYDSNINEEVCSDTGDSDDVCACAIDQGRRQVRAFPSATSTGAAGSTSGGVAPTALTAVGVVTLVVLTAGAALYRKVVLRNRSGEEASSA